MSFTRYLKNFEEDDAKLCTHTSMKGGKYYVGENERTVFYRKYTQAVNNGEELYLSEMISRGVMIDGTRYSKVVLDLDGCSEDSLTLSKRILKKWLIEDFQLEGKDITFFVHKNDQVKGKYHVYARYRKKFLMVSSWGLKHFMCTQHKTYDWIDENKALRLPGSLKKEGREKGVYPLKTNFSVADLAPGGHTENCYLQELPHSTSEKYRAVIQSGMEEKAKRAEKVHVEDTLTEGERDERIEWLLERLCEEGKLDTYDPWWVIVQTCINCGFDWKKVDDICRNAHGYQPDVIYKMYGEKPQTKRSIGTLIYHLSDESKKEYKEKFMKWDKGGGIIPGHLIKDMHQGDQGMKRAYINIARGQVWICGGSAWVWNPSTKLWYNPSSLCNDIGKRLEKLMNAYMAKLESGDEDKKEKDSMIKAVKRILNKARKATVGASISKLVFEEKEDNHLVDDLFYSKLNSATDLLPLKGGHVLSLRDGTVRDREYEDYFSFEVPIEKIGDPDHPDVVRYFSSLMGHDQDKLRYLQTVLGYGLTGEVADKSFYVLWGETDRGKTGLTMLIRKVMSEFATESKKTLLFGRDSESDPNAPSPELAKLLGKRLSVLDEVDPKVKEGAVKSITGGGRVTARKLRGDPITFECQTKILVESNKRIEFNTNDGALVNRVKYIPFQTHFVHGRKPNLEKNELEADHKLLQTIQTKLLPDVLAWLVEGSKRYYSENDNGRIIVPDSLRVQTERMIEEDVNMSEEWFSTCVVQEFNSKVLLSEVTRSHNDYMTEDPSCITTSRKLATFLREKGCTVKKDGKQIKLIDYKIVKPEQS